MLDLGRTCLVHPVIPHFSTTPCIIPSTRHQLTFALRNRDLSRPHCSHHASCRSDLSLGGRCAVHYCIWQGEAAGHCESPPRSRLRTPSTSLWVKCFADTFCCFPSVLIPCVPILANLTRIVAVRPSRSYGSSIRCSSTDQRCARNALSGAKS